MTEHQAKMLALLDQGEKDAAVALDDLRALWAREDEITAANRAKVLEAHEQGAKDRDEARMRFGGKSLSPEAAPHMSDLPVTPLAALGQSEPNAMTGGESFRDAATGQFTAAPKDDDS